MIDTLRTLRKINKDYKVVVIASFAYLSVIVLETALYQFNPITVVIAATGWFPLLVITSMNQQISKLDKALNYPDPPNLDKEKDVAS